MKIAVVFSGQGAQKPGMGKSLYDAYPAARDVFDAVPEFVKEYCFHGPEEKLMQTEITQPCMFTLSMAGYRAFKQELDNHGIGIGMMAGFSLGEYTALAAAGVFDFHTGFDIISKRGQWMSEAAAGSMAAVLGKLPAIEEAVAESSGAGMILPVNFNSPMQTVVAGEDEAMALFKEKAADKGLRVIPLKVSGAFHSPLMKGVSDQIADYLSAIPLREPEYPLYSNVTGENMQGQNLTDLIARQVMSPVRWEQSVRNMVAAGADTFVEVGVGTTLAGLIRKIDRSVKTYVVQDAESMSETLGALSQG